MNDVLCAPLSNYRQGASKLTGIANKTIWHIKADWRMQSSRLGSHKDRMELSDFDKSEICINGKIIHVDNKQDNKVYIIKTRNIFRKRYSAAFKGEHTFKVLF